MKCVKKIVLSLVVLSLFIPFENIIVFLDPTERVLAQETPTPDDDIKLETIVGIWQSEGEKASWIIGFDKIKRGNQVYSLDHVTVQEEAPYIYYAIDYKQEVKPEPIQLVLAHDSTTDRLKVNSQTYERYSNKNLTNYIKDMLTDYEPINLEQLLEIPDSVLVTYYALASQNQDYKESDRIHVVYEALAVQYPDLELLKGEEYAEYLDLSQEIIRQSKWTFPLLNTAVPRQILVWYYELGLKEGRDGDAWIQFLNRIQSAYDSYQVRRDLSGRSYLDSYQWPEENSEEVVGLNTDLDAEVTTPPANQDLPITPFDGETAFKYVKQMEGFNDDIALNFSTKRADGSLELVLVSRSIQASGGSGTVDKVIVYPDGTYYSLYQ